MDAPVHISETRQGKLLARLAAMTERMAMIAAERAEQAETAEEFRTYSDAVVKHAKSLRMTLALENRLMRDTARHDREHRAELELQTQEARARRRQRLWTDLAAEVCNEYEEPDFRDEVLTDLQDRLEEEARLATFLDEPFEVQLDRLKRVFDLGKYAYDDDDDPQPSPDSVPAAPADTS